METAEVDAEAHTAATGMGRQREVWKPRYMFLKVKQMSTDSIEGLERDGGGWRSPFMIHQSKNLRIS